MRYASSDYAHDAHPTDWASRSTQQREHQERKDGTDNYPSLTEVGGRGYANSQFTESTGHKSQVNVTTTLSTIGLDCSILLGLLAKIKCSICSYQFNI